MAWNTPSVVCFYSEKKRTCSTTLQIVWLYGQMYVDIPFTEPQSEFPAVNLIVLQQELKPMNEQLTHFHSHDWLKHVQNTWT